MKKSKLLALSAATLLLSTSCAEDKYLESTEGDGTVMLTVSLPGAEFGSRALGDGLSADKLAYAVYDASTDALVMSDEASFNNSLSTNVSLTLVNGKSYKIAFFAHNALYGGVYTFSAEDKSVTVDYEKMSDNTNARDYDCFYKMEEINVAGSLQKSVVLTRPVAQVNWGTSDLTSDAVQNAYGDNSNVRTKFYAKAYSKLDLLSGESSEEVEITPSKVYRQSYAAKFGAFPVEGYDYLNMMYLLLPQGESSLVDCKLEVYRKSTLMHTVNVPNVPVERNYRTNIYGALLTSAVDIVVEKEPNFDGSYNKEIWKGEVKEPVADADGNYAITSSAELAGLARLVNNGNTLAGKKVTLKSDLDLNNISWTPIGIGDGNSAERVFNGSFDGEGHTIKNLKISLKGKNSTFAGLFGRAWSDATMSNVIIDGVSIDATGVNDDASHGTAAFLGGGKVKEISNVIVKNAKIKGYHYAGSVTGNIYGNVKDCEVSGIEIVVEPRLMVSGNKAGKYDYGDKAGAIFGFHGEGNYTVSGNKASDVKITGFRDLGGMFGAILNNVTYSNNSINNGEITVSLKNTDNLCDDSTWGNVAEIVGRPFATSVDGGGNEATNVSVYKPSSVVNIDEMAAALSVGGYIAIDADLDFTSIDGNVEVTKPVTIDLKDRTVTVKHGQIKNSSTLAFIGEAGKITGPSQLVINNAGGTLVINGGTFEATSANKVNGADPVAIHNSGNIEINGGRISAYDNAVICNFADWKNYNNSVVINGGEFVSTNNYALNIYGNGDSDNGNRAEINSGTFIGATGGGRADTGVDVTINNGVFIGKGKFHGFCSGAESYGSAKTNVTVKGGYFWGGQGDALCRANSSKMTVSGGWLNKTTGGYTLASGCQEVAESTSLTVDGVDYTFTTHIVAQ